LQQVISLLLRNTPAFRETNLFDATEVCAQSAGAATRWCSKIRRATRQTTPAWFRSRVDAARNPGRFGNRHVQQDQLRQHAQDPPELGIPIYIIGTANMFKKITAISLPATDGVFGMPGRMSWLQADNTLQTFREGDWRRLFPVTFEGELPKSAATVQRLLRSQYSLAFNPGDVHDGKQHKLKVSVDVDGDGTYDDKEYVIQARSSTTRPSRRRTRQELAVN
jgi:hypothetical protein